MKGWIIYTAEDKVLRGEEYEAKRFMDSAAEHGVECEVFAPDQFDLFVDPEGRDKVMIDGQMLDLPDFLLPRMGSSTTYFALAAIRHMEQLGVHVVNSSASIEIVKDKLYSQQILAQNNIPVPKTMLVKFPVNIDIVEKQLGFPLVVKSLSGSKGMGVYLCESKGKLLDLMDLIENTNSAANIILQEFIADSVGTDLRVLTLGGTAIACMKRTAVSGNFKSNINAGGEATEFKITPEIEWLASSVSQVLDLEFAGVDLLFHEDHFKVCEANSSPGFQGLEACCDIDVASEVYNFLRVRLGKF